LGFESISVERKIQAVSRVASGEKVQPVAKDVGVGSQDFYIHLERKGAICFGRSIRTS